jgi:ATP/ADP translocase
VFIVVIVVVVVVVVVVAAAVYFIIDSVWKFLDTSSHQEVFSCSAQSKAINRSKTTQLLIILFLRFSVTLSMIETPSSAEVKNAWNYTSTPQYAFMALCSVTKDTGTTLPFT